MYLYLFSSHITLHRGSYTVILELEPVFSRVFSIQIGQGGLVTEDQHWKRLSSHVPGTVPGTGTFPERGTTLMKDFYTKLFPERSRSRSGTRNMERGTWPRSTFPASMGRGVYISLRQPEPVGYEIGTVGPQTLHCSVRPPRPQVVGRSSRTS